MKIRKKYGFKREREMRYSKQNLCKQTLTRKNLLGRSVTINYGEKVKKSTINSVESHVTQRCINDGSTCSTQAPCRTRLRDQLFLYLCQLFRGRYLSWSRPHAQSVTHVHVDTVIVIGASKQRVRHNT